MTTAGGRIRSLPPLVLIAYAVVVLLFALGFWTGDRPVMAVAALGALVISLAWWISS